MKRPAYSYCQASDFCLIPRPPPLALTKIRDGKQHLVYPLGACLSLSTHTFSLNQSTGLMDSLAGLAIGKGSRKSSRMC